MPAHVASAVRTMGRVRARGVALLVALVAASLVVIVAGRGGRAPSTVHVAAPTAHGPPRRASTSSAASSTAPATPTTATTTAIATTTSRRPETTPALPVHGPTTTLGPTARAPGTTASAPLLVSQLSGIGGARQVVTVVAARPGSPLATVSAYQRDVSGWTRVLGPWSAYIGRNGVAPVGAKREGDGRTPSGVFGLDFAFGIGADPGTRLPFRRITGPNIVWDDDPTSPLYNEWVDTTATSAGADPEPMDVASYRDGVVIVYNAARTPGLGSGIFLHVSHASPTSGCVSLAPGAVLDILRWLDPAQSPRIAIGTLASLTSN